MVDIAKYDKSWSIEIDRVYQWTSKSRSAIAKLASVNGDFLLPSYV